MDAFRAHLPLVQSLRTPGLKDRHWARIEEQTGTPRPVVWSDSVLRLTAAGWGGA
jgi:hypothetical protein